MSGLPTQWMDPPPESSRSECEECGSLVANEETWQIRHDCLCLDCAVQPAVDLLSGSGIGVSPAEIERARDVIVLWAATASGEHLRRMERSARSVMFSAEARAQP